MFMSNDANAQKEKNFGLHYSTNYLKHFGHFYTNTKEIKNWHMLLFESGFPTKDMLES